MEKTYEKQIERKNMLANLPDTFQLTDEMNFRKYDLHCSRIFYAKPTFSNFGTLQSKMQKIRMHYGYAFISCKGIIQYL